jgi:FkbM family methyltransferase
MASYVILVGSVKFPRNRIIKKLIEKSEKKKVLGFIDSYNEGKKVEDVPVIALNKLNSFIGNLSPDIKRNLEFYFLFPFNTKTRKQVFEYIENQIGKILRYKTYEEISDKFGKVVEKFLSYGNPINYWFGDYNKERAKKILKKLKDTKSRLIMENWLKFRETLNPKYLDYVIHPDIYLPNDIPILQKLPDKFNLLDIGAYDGDTLKFFVEKIKALNKEIDTYISFEPSQKYFFKLLKTIENLSKKGFKAKTFLFKQGCGDKFAQTILTYSMGCPTIIEAVNVSKEELALDESIEIVPPDEVIRNYRIDILKMDIEGFEMFCLKGLRRIIQESKPILEISIYHHPEDIYIIPEFIESLSINYDMYIRVHDKNFIDTVLYCIPQ